jgi:SAM-dependent methyltransferase/uncharacterized Rossmann fold enzyme
MNVIQKDLEAGSNPLPLSQVYERLWENTAYRKYAPGEHYVDEALEILRPKMGASFIDFGCGTGRPALELRKRGYSVVGIDFAENCLDEGVDIPFLVADLTKRITLTAQFGFCTDVLEHVSPENVDDVLLTIADCVKQGVFFSIALDYDEFGPLLIGKPLHLTVRDAKWWREKLGQFWPHLKLTSQSDTLLSLACFHDVKVFRQGARIEALCNTPDDIILRHVAINSDRDIQWVSGSEAGDIPCLIVGGGPSLKNTLPVIKQSAEMGCPIFALNAASKYLTENGISCWQIIIDPREHNIELVDEKANGHILASQCHPSVFDKCSNLLGFHVAMEGIGDHIKDLRKATLIGGGITSGLTALALAYTLGYRTIHLHGYDSSDADNGDAHAYSQGESRAEKKRIDCMFKGKHYRCSFAMYKQAEEFEKFSRMLADLDTVIHVHGHGLLPAIAMDIAEKQTEAA